MIFDVILFFYNRHINTNAIKNIKIYLANKMKTNFRLIIIVLSILFNCNLAEANTNQATIKGKVIDQKNQPIEFATATLISPKTKEIIKGEICNAKGEFSMNKVNSGEYILSVSMVGYNGLTTEKLIIDGKTPIIEKEIILSESTETLTELVVVGNKKFIEQSVDKIIINPEASITSASENVYEILRKLPGVNIDNNDNITLKGMQGVKILIDDKPTYVSSTQFAALLKGMQGKNIERIEIIENPSARYDAEGNSGIINIKTKHQKAPGFNGNVNSGASYASRFGWNGGIDLNMNYGKFNLYGNYSIYNWAGENGMSASRRFTGSELEGSYQLIESNGAYNGTAHNYKIGADYYLTKNHVISALFRGNSGFNNDRENSTTSFTDKFKNVDSSLVSNSFSKNNWKSSTYNLNYKWDVDSTGQSLSFDIDYAKFNFVSPANQNGHYFDANGVALNREYEFVKNQGNDIRIITSKLDYNLPINKKINIEAGLKASFVETNSYIDMTGYMDQYNKFIYQENIQAAYLNARAQFNKTSLQLGLRLENTVSKGNSVSTNQVNDTMYLKLFPSFFVQQQLTDNHSLNFKYSYRIGRPSYHNLNPFKWMVDPYTYNVGNPNLKPQFTQSLGLSHNYKGALITSLGMNYTTGLFTEIIRQDDAARTVYQTMDNLNNSLDINLSETFQFKPTKWWGINGTVTGMYKTIAMTANENNVLNMYSMMANMSNNINLPYKIDLELSANYMSDQLISNIVVLSRYSIDLGLQKKVLKDNGVIKVSVNDIFNTGINRAYAKHENVDIEVINKHDTRRLNISFSYRFGKDKFDTRANRTTSSNEEQNRSSK